MAPEEEHMRSDKHCFHRSGAANCCQDDQKLASLTNTATVKGKKDTKDKETERKKKRSLYLEGTLLQHMLMYTSPKKAT